MDKIPENAFRIPPPPNGPAPDQPLQGVHHMAKQHKTKSHNRQYRYQYMF